MATYDWGNLPLVALRNILKYLETKDALTVTSTCKHWRQAILMFDGYRESLMLKASEAQKSQFLSQIHRRYVQRLHIILDCGEEEAELEPFIEQIIPMFSGIGNIKELVFLVPESNLKKGVKLMVPFKSSTIERMIHTHITSIKSISFFGCGIVNQKVKITEHPILKKYLRNTQVIAYTLSNGNLNNFNYLKSLVFDYDMLDQNVLQSLANLPKLTHLSLNITRRSHFPENEVNWDVLKNFPNTMDLAVNITSVYKDFFPNIIKTILVGSMPLNRVRVMFCEVFDPIMILHIGSMFKYTLREFVWVDAARNRHKNIKLFSGQESEGDIHPLIWLCWQCSLLEKLVLHGYWVWQYDLLGMARLRSATMRALEVSATYALAPHNPRQDTDIVHPVIYRETHQPVGEYFIKQINEFLSFKWEPILNWNTMDRALLPNAQDEDKYKYIMKQILPPI